ncbi:hypothetical protein [Nocardiopsis dassonvillei]|uniref:hypothetical protein n=1 Tax=Nocardiopsis dassonvillei TaxID=2014 RepID=UPI003644FE83
MTRKFETALLHGHPTREEEAAQLLSLRERYPSWQINSCLTGYEALHRTEIYNERTSRVGITTTVRHSTLTELDEALTVQQALRGEGAEPVR